LGANGGQRVSEAQQDPQQGPQLPAPPEAQGTVPDGSPQQSRNSFWKGVLWFGAPIVILSVLSTGGQAVRQADAQIVFFSLWALAVVMWLVAFIGAIVFHVRRRTDIGNGALVAMGIGAVTLFGTCVYNLSSV
jgi:predicted permease